MENKKPFITIITPTYNRADLLDYAILSVINQKQDIPFDREMIIVDDGSTDDTAALVKKYIKKYPHNIQYFYQKNSGIPGVGRNVGLDHMNKKSDYVIFLDSDDELTHDCVYMSLIKWDEISIRKEYDEVLGFYFLCKSDSGTIVGKSKIFSGNQTKRKMHYGDFLYGDLGFELLLILKSSFFLENRNLRFSEEFITEGWLWSKMRKYVDSHGLSMYVFDCIGRLYRTNHTSEKNIVKTISKKRFQNNAVGNEEIIKIIGGDFLSLGYKKQYAKYLSAIGINRIMFGSKKKGINFLRKSFKMKKSFLTFSILLISLVWPAAIGYIYRIYIA